MIDPNMESTKIQINHTNPILKKHMIKKNKKKHWNQISDIFPNSFYKKQK